MHTNPKYQTREMPDGSDEASGIAKALPLLGEKL
jgi:hypothetical protein